MLIPSDSHLAVYKYVEVAAFRQWVDKDTKEPMEAVVRHRDWNTKEPIMLEWGEELREYMRKHDNSGVYTSVFRYDGKDVDSSTQLGSLYFDFDADDPVAAQAEAIKTFNYLRQHVPGDSMRVYFTGAKGFHLEVEALALGIEPSNELAAIFRFIAEHIKTELSLETIDFSVYDPRRMWRLPNSKHQKTGLFKVEVGERGLRAPMDAILSYAASPRQPLIPSLQLTTTANQWYRDWVGQYEEKLETERQEAAARRRKTFEQYGTSLLKHGHSKGYVETVWRNTVEILKGTTINRNMELSKQAYKLYLTILEAKLDVDEVTDTLHELGLDIGLEPRETTATLASALRAARRKHETNPRSIYG